MACGGARASGVRRARWGWLLCAAVLALSGAALAMDAAADDKMARIQQVIEMATDRGNMAFFPRDIQQDTPVFGVDDTVWQEPLPDAPSSALGEHSGSFRQPFNRTRASGDSAREWREKNPKSEYPEISIPVDLAERFPRALNEIEQVLLWTFERMNLTMAEMFPLRKDLHGGTSAVPKGQEEAFARFQASRRSSNPLNILVLVDQLPTFPREGRQAYGMSRRLVRMIVNLRAHGHNVTVMSRNIAFCCDYKSGERDHLGEVMDSAALFPYARLGVAVEFGATPNCPTRFITVSIHPETQARDRQTVFLKQKTIYETVSKSLWGQPYDIAILSDWYMPGSSIAEDAIPVIKHASPYTRILLLHDEVHSAYTLQYAQAQETMMTIEHAKLVRLREKADLEDADGTILISAVDVMRANGFANATLYHLTEGVEISDLQQGMASPPFEDRHGVVFTGARNSRAMLDMEWFLQRVWPRVVASIPDAIFYVVGGDTKSWTYDIKRIADMRNIRVLGYVDNLKDTLSKARVAVAPCVVGTGMSTKILMSMSHGVPTVTTAFGAAGYYPAASSGLQVASTADEFAQSIITLLQDRDAWYRVRNAHFNFAQTAHDPEKVAKQLDDILQKAMQRPPKPLAQLQPRCFSPWNVDRFHRLTREPEMCRRRILARIQHAEDLLDQGKATDAIFELQFLANFNFVDYRPTSLKLRIVYDLHRGYEILSKASDSELDNACTQQLLDLGRNARTRRQNALLWSNRCRMVVLRLGSAIEAYAGSAGEPARATGDGRHRALWEALLQVHNIHSDFPCRMMQDNVTESFLHLGEWSSFDMLCSGFSDA